MYLWPLCICPLILLLLSILVAIDDLILSQRGSGTVILEGGCSERSEEYSERSM